MDLRLWTSLLMALASAALLLTSLSGINPLQLAPAAVLSALAGVAASPRLRAGPPTQPTLLARMDGTTPEHATQAAEAPESPEPATPQATELEQLLERMGERYLADLRELHDAFEHLYQPQLAAQQAEISALRSQLAQLEQERDQLQTRVQEQEQRRAKLIADVQTMRDELSGKLASVVQILGPDGTTADLPNDTRAEVRAAPIGPGAPSSPPPTANGTPSPNRPTVLSTRRNRR